MFQPCRLVYFLYHGTNFFFLSIFSFFLLEKNILFLDKKKKTQGVKRKKQGYKTFYNSLLYSKIWFYKKRTLHGGASFLNLFQKKLLSDS